MRYFIAFLVVALGVLVALSIYQPPMRLMPAPAVFVDGNTNVFDNNPQQNVDPEIAIFYATNRMPLGLASDRLYAIVPGRDMLLGEATLRIGEEGTTWQNIYAWSTGAGNDDRPFLHLRNMAETASIEPDAELDADALAWFAQVEKALQENRDSDIIVYVHGANTTMERAAGQAAQLKHFTGRNSVVILFAWPTAENFFWYPRDMVTAFGAAPHLARLVELLAEHTSANNIDVFTYSAGAIVGSTGLSIAGRAAQEPGAAQPRLGEIYHAAPDADFREFVTELRDYAPVSRRSTVAVNLHDSALRLSQFINRGSRAGRPDMRELDEEDTEWLLKGARESGLNVLRVRPENIPGLSRRSHTFWYDDPWISSDVLITLLYHLDPGLRGLQQGTSDAGVAYWTFGPDYAERLAEVIEKLRMEGRELTHSAE